MREHEVVAEVARVAGPGNEVIHLDSLLQTALAVEALAALQVAQPADDGRESAALAAEKKIGITVKPHGGLNATGPQCRALIAKVGHPNFRLWYDPGNIFYYSDAKLSPVDDAATVDGLVAGMSVKDYRHPKEVLLTPGTGQVDFKAVMARLKKGGFTSGPLIVETLLAGDLPVLLAEAKKARTFVETFASA